jgi:hypothetical protein
MRIGIEMNGVLRDTILKFRQLYEKFNIDLIPELEEGEEPVFKYEVIEPIDSLDLLNHFTFPSKDEFYSFMYEEHPMEIFGHSPSVEMSTMNDLNEFYYEMRDNHDISIVSDEIGKSKPASLFFISKFGCLLEKVKFYSNQTIKSMWDEVDVLLTANPDLLLNYPQNKIVVKYETEYNKHVSSPYTISSLKEFDLMLENILKTI